MIVVNHHEEEIAGTYIHICNVYNEVSYKEKQMNNRDRFHINYDILHIIALFLNDMILL